MAEAEQIPQHRHCLKCSRAFIGDDRYCSDSCKEEKKKELGKQKRKLLMIWAVAVVLMLVVIVWSS
ncbi:MAG: DUF2116 family Zn-ribbon domain-containing protein [Thermoplasmatales archaeon]|jgi:predicted nucleic acid-binding Zn ribbon protein|nr:DUF2116 family Zn-ribbon domain-containing protein [Thermoplasmatales archaeon]